MSGDVVMSWKLGGVSFEIRGDLALTSEQCEDLAPIADGLSVFAHKYGLVGQDTRPAQSQRHAVEREIVVGDRVRVTAHAPHRGEVGTVSGLNEDDSRWWPIEVDFPDGTICAYLPSHLEWVGP